AQNRAAMTGGAPVTAARSRPVTTGHRPPPPRRTFSSGQRALLWAAGVLGALAIVIAVLIVLNAQDRRDQQSPAPTITNTITETTPPGSAPASPTAMPGQGRFGTESHVDAGFGVSLLGATERPPVTPAVHQTRVSEHIWLPEQT
ncbi:serine/threonine protein kinase, partial [Mycolicibacterium sp. KC 300]|nr:serine/threonine protein kinase [Mycolicibacterium arseniciresistens]